ncbi:MAG: dienelactone hydrolase family protein, partial [Alphaproteobacteria bacterium]
MLKLTRPEGTLPEDLHTTRRALGPLFFAGYAAAAVSASAQAQTIHTDEAGLICQSIFIPGPDQPIPAYIARPNTRGRYPTIIVIPEVFGLHEYIRDTCRRLAKLGYAALAPDPFFRDGDPAPLTDFAKIQAIVSKATNAQVMGDLDSIGRWIERQPFSNNNFGITGFCWGGAVVWMALARFKGYAIGFSCLSFG